MSEISSKMHFYYNIIETILQFQLPISVEQDNGGQYLSFNKEAMLGDDCLAEISFFYKEEIINSKSFVMYAERFQDDLSFIDDVTRAIIGALDRTLTMPEIESVLSQLYHLKMNALINCNGVAIKGYHIYIYGYKQNGNNNDLLFLSDVECGYSGEGVNQEGYGAFVPNPERTKSVFNNIMTENGNAMSFKELFLSDGQIPEPELLQRIDAIELSSLIKPFTIDNFRRSVNLFNDQTGIVFYTCEGNISLLLNNCDIELLICPLYRLLQVVFNKGTSKQRRFIFCTDQSYEELLNIATMFYIIMLANPDEIDRLIIGYYRK